MTHARPSWIVQQLLLPVGFHNPFGNILGTLNNVGRDIFSKIFDPEYMGAAEFEWGALPDSLGRMINFNDLIIQTLPIIDNIDFSFQDEEHMNKVSKLHPSKEVIYLGSKDKMVMNLNKFYPVYDKSKKHNYREDGKSDFKEITKNDYGSFYQSLHKSDNYNEQLKGWYDLINDFAIFLNDKDGKKMSKRFYKALTIIPKEATK